MMDDYDDDPFSRALGLPATTHNIERLPEIVPEQKVEIKTYVQNDYEFARQNLRDVAAVGAQLLMDAASSARQTGAPEGYAAAASVLKTVIDVNEKLVKLSELHAKVTDGKKGEIKKEKEETTETYVENKTLIVTSNDMLDLIKRVTNDRSEETK